MYDSAFGDVQTVACLDKIIALSLFQILEAVSTSIDG